MWPKPVRPAPPPHPRDKFILGSAPRFLQDILQTFVDGWREVGDVAWYRAPRPMYVLAHPEDVQHILSNHREHHPRSGYVRKMLKNVMGEGLFTCDERLWRHQVNLVSPPFNAERIAAWGPAMATGAEELAARLAADGETTKPILPELVRSSLDVIGRILFGQEQWALDGAALCEALITSWEWAIPRVTGFPTPIEPLTSQYRAYRRAIATRDRIIEGAIAARRHDPGDDLISTFLQMRDPRTGAALDSRGLHDAVTTALFGVYKGPPIALAWALYLLSLHPDVRERVEQEVDIVLAGRPPTLDDLEPLDVTRMVVDETLRLYPTLWLMSRPPDSEEVFRGYLVPERVYLLAVPYITHRHPDFWDDPEEFRPERFSPDRVAARHPYAYIPFGHGHRACIGRAYSLAQVPLMLARLVQRLRFDVEPGYGPAPTTIFLLRPPDGLAMRVSSRDGESS